jgi:LacI family transcriptional regulator
LKNGRNQWKGKNTRAVTLRALAEHVGLTPGTVSAVLNDSPASHSFPQRTKDRVLRAARELQYRPNFFARSLRVRRTYTVGIITEEIGDAYGATVISGIERYLKQHGFLFLTVAHRHDMHLLETYSRLLLQRGVEGLITIDTSVRHALSVPTVAIAGHRSAKGVTNLVVDHRAAVRMALEHLAKLGHQEIAFMKGPSSSSDSEVRWRAILEISRQLGLRVRPELTIRLRGVSATPDLSYPFVRRLLSQKRRFTALFAYNDNSAIGAIRAMDEAGLRVPADISVVGFDDIQAAAFWRPPLTTVRQPLEKMGEIAARTLLDLVEGRDAYVPEILIKPDFMVRHSTARAPADSLWGQQGKPSVVIPVRQTR